MPISAKSRPDNGFTLIEVLVAVILITLVITPLDRLLIRAERLSDTASQRFVATNIAQEGIELVHVVRDNNWFTFSEGERWLDKGLCQDESASYEDTNRQFTLDPELVRLGLIGDFEQAQLYLQPNGSWSHVPTTQSTNYSRVISIDCSTKFDDLPHVTVTSQVTWRDRDDDREVTIKEKLYNWYPQTQLSAGTP